MRWNYRIILSSAPIMKKLKKKTLNPDSHTKRCSWEALTLPAMELNCSHPWLMQGQNDDQDEQYRCWWRKTKYFFIYMSISFLSCKSFYSMKSILKGKNRSSNAHGMNKLCANCKIAPFYIRYTISSWHILWVLKNLVSLHLEAAIATSCFGLQFHNLIFKKITEIKKIKKIILFMYLIVLTII